MIPETVIFEVARKFWGPRTLDNCALKLAEECGEVCGAVSKMPEGRASQRDLEDEMGDVLIVLSQLAAKLETTLENLLEKRWTEILRRNEAEKITAKDGTPFDSVCTVCNETFGEHNIQTRACPNFYGRSFFHLTNKFTP